MKKPERKKAFTLIELLITIAVIAILMATLLPALNAAREKGFAIRCTSNLKQISTLAFLYAEANDGYGPPFQENVPGIGFCRWQDFLIPYITPGGKLVSNGHRIQLAPGIFMPKGIFACPSPLNGPIDTAKDEIKHYGLNRSASLPEPYQRPSRRIMHTKRPSARGYIADIFYPDDITDRCFRFQNTREMSFCHQGRANIAFADGHCEARKIGAIPIPGTDYFWGYYEN